MPGEVDLDRSDRCNPACPARGTARRSRGSIRDPNTTAGWRSQCRPGKRARSPRPRSASSRPAWIHSAIAPRLLLRFDVGVDGSGRARRGSADAPASSTVAERCAVASRYSASEISDICSATRNSSGPRGRTPIPTFGMPPAQFVEQRLDDPQFATRAEPVLDAGQQRAARDDQHRAAQQGRRRADSDELGGADGAQQEERTGQHDEHDADGEHEQRPSAAGAVRVPHARPRPPGSARAARRAAAAATTAPCPPEPRLRRRYSSGAISGCCAAVKNATSVTDGDDGRDAVLNDRDAADRRRLARPTTPT